MRTCTRLLLKGRLIHRSRHRWRRPLHRLRERGDGLMDGLRMRGAHRVQHAHHHRVPLVLVESLSVRRDPSKRRKDTRLCEKRMQLLAWTGRVSHAEALPGSAAENSSPLSLRLYIRYGSSISISIDLSLIHGISVVTVAVADGENS